MKIIGITGGVGAGKTTVINMLKEMCNCYVVLADDEAKILMQKGNVLEPDAIRLFGNDAYNADNTLNKAVIAKAMYNNPEIKKEWIAVVHPAVNQHIFRLIEECRLSGKYDYFFIEAALLIENNYDKICDELWYVYADTDVRIDRLANSRNYTREYSEGIIKNQMSDEVFRKHCRFVIDTGKDLSDTRKQLEKKLSENV